MSGWTRINLDEVEDVAPKFGMPDGMSARFPKGELGSEKVAASLQSLGPNMRGPFGHRHEEQEELYVILAGGGRMRLDDEVIEIRARDVIRVAPQTMRAFESGPDGLELLAIGGPIGGDRGEVVQGWWAD
ncbi:MAG TPA: cupin domain-containing protein [Gaiellaceae bacterium]|nr:cupin domain-containing protein [Gaiellaceae bacterium]